MINTSAVFTEHTLITERELARMLAVSVASVRRWRLLKTGPGYHKIGSSVRYDRSDVEEYLKRCRTAGAH